jgi:A/G-specific adenine glycosylase
VAEIMLQQTRVETVIPYYERWMKRFPSVMDLAEADIDEVLRHWEGLGYYRRAHNIHKAAVLVVEQYDGQLPHTLTALKTLPGIGAYTAAAIVALAFNSDAIALDGNLRRVFARLLDLEIDPRQPEGERRIRVWAGDLLPIGQASAFNQGLMDLGAMVCLPRIPLCENCPLSTWCLAYPALFRCCGGPATGGQGFNWSQARRQAPGWIVGISGRKAGSKREPGSVLKARA